MSARVARRYDFTPRLFRVACGAETHYLRLTPPNHIEALNHWAWELVVADLSHEPVACAEVARAMANPYAFASSHWGSVHRYKSWDIPWINETTKLYIETERPMMR